MSSYRIKLLSGIAVLALALAAGGCAERVANRGNQPDPDVIAELKPGQQNKAQVKSMLGSPSSIAAFDDNTWLYVSQKGTRSWFFREQAVERDVLRIHFNETGQIASIDSLTLADGQEVALVDRVTPSRGQELTFFDQMWQALIGGPGSFLGGNVDATNLPR